MNAKPAVPGSYYAAGRLRYRPTSAVGFGCEIRLLASRGLTERDIQAALGVDPGTIRAALRGWEAA